MPQRVYKASPRHCEPITAQNPGVKCPALSLVDAQRLLDGAQAVGETLQATMLGVGFVARITSWAEGVEVWHGYPEAWDRMDIALKARWLREGSIQRRDLRRYKTREQVRREFGGRLV